MAESVNFCAVSARRADAVVPSQRVSRKRPGKPRKLRIIQSLSEKSVESSAHAKSSIGQLETRFGHFRRTAVSPGVSELCRGISAAVAHKEAQVKFK